MSPEIRKIIFFLDGKITKKIIKKKKNTENWKVEKTLNEKKNSKRKRNNEKKKNKYFK